MGRLNRASLVVALVLASCGPSIEERYEPDVERLCNAWCDLLVSCPELNEDRSRNECMDICVDHDAPYWENACNREYEARKECQVDLSCQELHDQSIHSDLSDEQQPCNDEKWEHAFCLDEKVQ